MSESTFHLLIFDHSDGWHVWIYRMSRLGRRYKRECIGDHWIPLGSASGPPSALLRALADQMDLPLLEQNMFAAGDPGVPSGTTGGKDRYGPDTTLNLDFTA